MKLVFILAALLISCVELGQSTPNLHHNHQNHSLWHTWKQIHTKQYDNQDVEARRFQIWKATVDRINEHNLRHDLGLETYRMGVNQFTDLTWDEFKQQYLGGLIQVDPTNVDKQAEQDEIDITDIPKEWDWRKHNRVTPVKNQGNCGSCWAFSSAGAMEGQMKAKRLKLRNLSPQQLVDCTFKYGNHGCNGGWMTRSFEYASKFGMESFKDYPYETRVGRCRYNESKVIMRINSYRQVKYGNENDLLDALYNVGPTSVGVNVISAFMSYRSGIFSSKSCSSKRIDHAILAVGYGVQDGEKYWLVKNSWGTWWGEKGYVKIARDKDNMCGIASLASVPLVK